jgi:alpha-mannosidase
VLRVFKVHKEFRALKALIKHHPAGAWLVRLAHLYEAGEDAALSAPASVDLATLFAPRAVAAAVEMTLPGAAPLAGVRPTTYRTEGGLDVTLPVLPPPPSGPGLEVTLAPMEVRTFLVGWA